MAKAKNTKILKTPFGTYTTAGSLGQGGAGTVFEAITEDGTECAIKILSAANLSTDKKKRFKNEIGFLLGRRHDNIVAVSDYGLTEEGVPFYVMPRYSGSFRKLLAAGLNNEKKFSAFMQILDAVEAFHLMGVVHRDLKPENVLWDARTNKLAVADFGIASFNEDLMATVVETAHGSRLANFQYAAPEQRTAGRSVGMPADIYALGLMFNEAFTGEVPHGTDYKTVASADPNFAFLDPVIASMIRQGAADRIASIGLVKGQLELHRAEQITQQRLSAISAEVVPVGTIDDPLAREPLKIVGVDWDDGVLSITLDRPVHRNWITAFQNMHSFTSLMGAEPRRFTFSGNIARVPIEANSAQKVIDYFKG